METNDNIDDSSAVTAREKLNAYLGLQMKVAVSDGRVLIGEFMCTDKDRNLILGNCDEYIPLSRDGQDSRQALSRTLSLAIVPGYHIASLSVAKKSSTPTNTTVEDKQQESNSDKKDREENGKDGDHDDKNGDEVECTEQNDQPHETVNTTPAVVT